MEGSAVDLLELLDQHGSLAPEQIALYLRLQVDVACSAVDDLARRGLVYVVTLAPLKGKAPVVPYWRLTENGRAELAARRRQ